MALNSGGSIENRLKYFKKELSEWSHWVNILLTQAPFLKKHSLLKLEDIYRIQCLKLHYKIERGAVPEFFKSFTIHNWNIHDHFTRGRNDLRPTKVKSNWLRHFLPRLVLETPGELLANLHSTTINTFSKNLKQYYIDSYTTACTRHQCLPCGRNMLL